MHARMRHHQIRLVDARLAIEQQIEIQNARPVRNATLATPSLLDRKKGLQQRSRRQLGLHVCHGIHEVGLIRITPGRRPVQGRATNEAARDNLPQSDEGAANLLSRIVQIAAKPDKGRMAVLLLQDHTLASA